MRAAERQGSEGESFQRAKRAARKSFPGPQGPGLALSGPPVTLGSQEGSEQRRRRFRPGAAAAEWGNAERRFSLVGERPAPLAGRPIPLGRLVVAGALGRITPTGTGRFGVLLKFLPPVWAAVEHPRPWVQVITVLAIEAIIVR